MTETHEQILAGVRTYVTDLLNNKLDPAFVFHSLEHTEDVADAASRLADHYNLTEDDRFVLSLAAWFHDTGYTAGQTEGHEEVSVHIATDFLKRHEVEEGVINRVVSAIRATKMPQSPLNLLEKILCDSDLMHLATDDFKAKNELFKQERQNILANSISKKEWRKVNIRFLEGHKYFTDYGQQNLEPQKQENLNTLRKKKQRKEIEKEEQPGALPYLYESGNEQDPQLDKNRERGIQTMFRTTSSNHFELSSLADGKANIMISVNAIIISVVLTVLLVRLPFYPQYLIPTIMLVGTCLSAMIFAILATRPSVSSGRFTEEDIRQKSTNLLFFGNFYRMKMEEYQWGMNELLKDKEYLYNSMIRDIYFLGVVLSRKYKLLRIAYTIFMWGLIATVIAFAIAAITSEMGSTTTGATEIIDY
ncbi:MAG TPA: Pycsar system effector family protein [Flavisolibacter sp.]|nr:Pycsar system effector family protein [Flavisolibacter sp.]